MTLTSLYRENTERSNKSPEQEYSLIITIRDPDKTSNVYNEVIQKINSYNFIYNPIRLIEHVGVSIDNRQ